MTEIEPLLWHIYLWVWKSLISHALLNCVAKGAGIGVVMFVILFLICLLNHLYIGSLARAQLKSWEARQVADIYGTEKASEVLRSALYSLQKVEDKSSASFKLTKELYLLVIGEILWRNRDNERALVSLKLALTFSEPLLKEHTDIARCYNAIGNSFFALNQPRKALEFFKKAYKVQKKLASENHF